MHSELKIKEGKYEIKPGYKKFTLHISRVCDAGRKHQPTLYFVKRQRIIVYL